MPVPASDFRLYHGNDLEVLAGILASELSKPATGGHLLDPDTILIPQPAMRRWLQKTLAEAHGIAANIEFLTPGEFVRRALDRNLNEPVSPVFDAGALRWRIFATLDDVTALRHPALRPVQHYLQGAQSAAKAWSLAGELTAAFEKYQAWRRHWLTRWDAGHDPDDWQAELWRRASRGCRHRGQSLADYFARFASDQTPAPRGLPARLFVFACLNVSPDVLRVIASAAKAGPLHFFLPSPSRKYWGDLRTIRERVRSGDDADLIDGSGEENPLLAANGRAGRDFFATLFAYDVVQPSGEVESYQAPGQTSSRLLARLQRDLLERCAPTRQADDPPAFELFDRSLQVHACHTRLREVQVLHEQLRALLETDPDLQPRDIAVMAPDIDGYAPHFQAVFGGASGSPRFLPYALADSGALAGAPLADLFMRLLELPLSRLTSNDVLELLAVPAVSERYHLDAAALATLSGWIAASGARWGLNAAHRARLGAPPEHAFTWAFGLERLLVGYMSGDQRELAGIAPWPQLEGSNLQVLDALLRVLRVLARLEEAGSQPQTAGRWCEVLGTALAELLPENLANRDEQQTRDRLYAELEAFRHDTGMAGLDRPIAAEVVRAHFRDRLSEADARQPFLTGGITVCRMVPMRLIPFKVICLLGMNDGEFPRRDPASAINRINQGLADPRQRQVGDRSIRDDDRFLFLQLLAASSDVFYLSYLGLDARDGRAREPSVLVSELLDVAKDYFTDGAVARKQFTLKHPLQPFSLRESDDPRDVRFDPAWRPAQLAGHEALQPLPVFAMATLPTTVAPDTTIAVDLQSLQRFWSNPHKAYLQNLGLHIDDKDQRLPDVEPYDAREPLHKHQLRERVLAALREQGDNLDFEALRNRLGAEGELPGDAAGDQRLRDLVRDMKPFVQALATLLPDVEPTAPFTLDLGRYRLHGRFDHGFREGFAHIRLGKLGGRHHVRNGLMALVLAALGQSRQLLEIAEFSAGDFGPRPRPSLPSPAAREALLELLKLREAGLARPLQFRPDSAWAFTKSMRKYEDIEAAWIESEKIWLGHDGGGEGRDPWTALALRGQDPFADNESDAARAFRCLAESVFCLLMPREQDATSGDSDD